MKANKMDWAMVILVAAVTGLLTWWSIAGSESKKREIEHTRFDATDSVEPAATPSVSTSIAVPSVQPWSSAELPNGSLSFSSNLTEWAIMQSDERLQESVASFGRVMPYPISPQTYALHLNDVYMFFSLKDTPELKHDELLKQIRVTGDVKWSVAPTQTNQEGVKRYKLDVTGIRDPFTIRLGDVAPITLEKRKPLTFTVEEAAGVQSSQLLFLTDDMLVESRLLVPDGATSFTIAFSEPMRREETVVKEFQGQWLDDRRLRVPVPQGNERSVVDLRNVFSVTGNYPEEQQRMLSIYKAKPRTISVAMTGELAGLEDRSRFYDAIIPSPNGERFIGAVRLSEPVGDEGGEYFGLVLEQKGKAPVVVEPLYHSPMAGTPDGVVWVDEERMFSWDWSSARVRNVLTGVTQTFAPSQKERYLNRAVYDPIRHEVNLLVRRPAPELGPDKSVIDLQIFKAEEPSKLVREVKGFSEAVNEYKYNFLSLPIRFTSAGVYRTKAEKGDLRTVFEFTNPVSGLGSASMEGFMIGADAQGQGVFVREWINYGEEGYGKLPKLWYWKPEQTPQRLPDPPAWPYPFGGGLAASADGKTWLLDAQTMKWSLAPWSAPGITAPPQHGTSYIWKS